MMPRPSQSPVEPSEPWWRDSWFAAAVLALAVFAAYHPVWHAGFVWDDDAHVTAPVLRPLHGLWRIWFEPGATQQYYPVLYSAFWLEHRAWGDAATGYHLANLALHACAAFLLLRVLRALSVPGAFLGAALFALHPVGVETVAWISEQKNTLSAVFYLLAALAYLRFDRERRHGWYALGLGLFLLAVLSKSVTATLPAALLVIFWWKRGRLSPMGDVLPLVPWLCAGVGAGLMTTWMERTHVGAAGGALALGFAERFLIAGRAAWFYLGKIFWPAGLTFIYPRWAIDARDPAQYLLPAAALAALAALWAVRARSRAPLAVGLLFVGTLFPALGFINVFPFIYSFVADHFQYLGAAVILSAAAAAVALGVRHIGPAPRLFAGVAMLGLLGFLGTLTRRQCAIYADSDTLWRATIARNPSAWMAYNNLAAGLLEKGRGEEAARFARMSLDADPGNAEANVTLGDALRQQGHLDEALSEYRKALDLQPGSVVAHANLGATLLQAGHADRAIPELERALELKPDLARTNANLADAYLQSGRIDDAITRYGDAIAYDPENVEAHANLGTTLAQKGRTKDAIAQFKAALAINPRFAIAEVNLGNVLLQAGRSDEAITHYAKALEIDPGSSAAHNNLGYCLLQAGRREEAIAHFRQALEIDPSNAGAGRNLSDALSGK
jgi:tetratricopeptide (TPR) repeat protein